MPMPVTADSLFQILWQSLDEEKYDLQDLKGHAGTSSHLVNDLGLDSLDLMEFFIRVQDYFGLVITKDEYRELMSIASVESYVHEHLSPSH